MDVHQGIVMGGPTSQCFEVPSAFEWQAPAFYQPRPLPARSSSLESSAGCFVHHSHPAMLVSALEAAYHDPFCGAPAVSRLTSARHEIDELGLLVLADEVFRGWEDGEEEWETALNIVAMDRGRPEPAAVAARAPALLPVASPAPPSPAPPAADAPRVPSAIKIRLRCPPSAGTSSASAGAKRKSSCQSSQEALHPAAQPARADSGSASGAATSKRRLVPLSSLGAERGGGGGAGASARGCGGKASGGRGNDLSRASSDCSDVTGPLSAALSVAAAPASAPGAAPAPACAPAPHSTRGAAAAAVAPEADGMVGKRGRLTAAVVMNGIIKRRCEQCGTSQTPQWREGGRLCNACGVRNRKKHTS